MEEADGLVEFIASIFPGITRCAEPIPENDMIGLTSAKLANISLEENVKNDATPAVRRLNDGEETNELVAAHIEPELTIKSRGELYRLCPIPLAIGAPWLTRLFKGDLQENCNVSLAVTWLVERAENKLCIGKGENCAGMGALD